MGLVYLPTWMVDFYGKCSWNIPYMDPMGMGPHTIPVSLGILDWEWYGNSMRPKNSHVLGGSLNIPLILVQSSNCLVPTTPHLIPSLCSRIRKNGHPFLNWPSTSQVFTTLRQSNVSKYICVWLICFFDGCYMSIPGSYSSLEAMLVSPKTVSS